MKFKVGDKVRVVRNETDTRAVIGDIGIIKGIRKTFPMYAVEFPIGRIQYHECQGFCGWDRGYWCGEGMIELVEKKPNECIVIYRKDSDVIAFDKRTGKKAVAKCSPDDEFDFNIGAKLAFDRLETLEKQDKEIKVGDLVKVVDCGKLYPYYNQKVKELANNNADVLAKFRYGMDFTMNEGLIWGIRMKVYAIKDDFCLLEKDDGSYILIGKKGIEKCE